MKEFLELPKAYALLQRARVRKIGYEKFNKKVPIIFSNSKQENKIDTINRVIMRLENYCREKCECIKINI